MALGEQDKRPSQWLSLDKHSFRNQFDSLESGRLSLELRAPGLMGGDLFGWYSTVIGTDDNLEHAVRSSLKSFSELAWVRLAHSPMTGDLLREFYAAVVPRQMRKALGEFFTPQWIAERVTKQAVELAGMTAKPARILDPSCGSGTFLVTALRRALAVARNSGLSRSEQTIAAINSVYGFDINPVSPLMSRVNLLLALGDRIEELEYVSFHVYQADSILIPEEHVGPVRMDESGAVLRIPLVIGNVMLPRALASLEAVEALVRVIDQSLRRNRATNTFAGRFQPELQRMGVTGEDLQDAIQAAVDLYDRLHQLHIDGKNGLWAHVIEQSFAPRALAPVDIVIGNPPWVSWKNLPQEWQDRSEPVWTQWGLWQRKVRGQGTPMSDISTLLLARAIASYCQDGIVALLLPEGILLNEPGGRAIRRCSLRTGGVISARKQLRLRPLYVDDFSSLHPFPDAANRSYSA